MLDFVISWAGLIVIDLYAPHVDRSFPKCLMLLERCECEAAVGDGVDTIGGGDVERLEDAVSEDIEAVNESGSGVGDAADQSVT